MNKIKVGDVFEIETAKGKAYFHYMFDDKDIGALIRILPFFHDNTPDNIKEIVKQKELFFIYFPLKYAVKLKIVNPVSNVPVGLFFRKPKYMRTEHKVRGEFLGWHIVNTNNLKRTLVSKLSEEEKKLSPWGVWNDTLLKERLEEGWTLDKWV